MTRLNGDILAILVTALLLVTIPQHAKVRNTGTLLMIFWAIVGNLTQGISAFLLMDPETVPTPTMLRWFDFSAAMLYVYPFGFSAGMVSLLRRLESIASTRQVSQSTSQRRRSLIVDLFVGLVLPLVLIPLRITVQGHRLDIIAGKTCIAPIYFSVVALFVTILPPFLLNLLNVVYSCLVLRWFLLRRRQFAALLHSSGTGMSKRRYVRLMALSISEVAIAFPIALFAFIYNTKVSSFRPYDSWDSVHADFQMVYTYPFDALAKSTQVVVILLSWLSIFVSITFFAFFGLRAETWTDFGRIIFDAFSVVFSLGRQTCARAKASQSDERSTVVVDSTLSNSKSSMIESPCCNDSHDVESKFSPNTPQSDWIFTADVQSMPASGHVLISSERIVVS